MIIGWDRLRHSCILGIGMRGLKEEEPLGPGLVSAVEEASRLLRGWLVTKPAFWAHRAPVGQYMPCPTSWSTNHCYWLHTHAQACGYGPWLKGSENRTLESQWRLCKDSGARAVVSMYEGQVVILGEGRESGWSQCQLKTRLCAGNELRPRSGGVINFYLLF